VGDRFGRVSPDVVEVVLGYLPAGRAVGLRDWWTAPRGARGRAGRASPSSGAVVLAWISTRLVGTLRVVLRRLFDLEEDRGIVRGKLFDFKVVLLGASSSS
jgi:hypothetical protein